MVSRLYFFTNSQADTPFEGGSFKVKLQVGPDYPSAPPKGYFLTKIFHPNVSEAGDICVNTLKKDWKDTYGFQHILVVLFLFFNALIRISALPSLTFRLSSVC